MDNQPAQPPLTPGQPQPAQPLPVPPAQAVKPGHKKTLVLLIILAGAFLIGGGAAAYVQYFQNSPSQVWERALSSSSQGLDKLIELSQQDAPKGTKVDAKVSVTSPIIVDASMQGTWNGSNGRATMSIGSTGLRVDGELVSIVSEDSQAPDVYFMLSGLDGVETLISLAGPDYSALASGLSELNEQWFSVDRSLFSQFALIPGSTEGGPSEQDINDMIASFSGVLNDTLFNADPTKGVFTVIEEVGKEDFEGTDTQRYTVGLNKENAKNFISSFADSLDSSGAYEYLGVGEFMDKQGLVDSAYEKIDGMDFSKATADVWVESSGKYVRNIRIYPNENDKESEYIDFGIPFDGGNEIPFQVSIVFSENEMKNRMTFGLSVDQTTADSRVWFDVDTSSGFLGIVASGELSIKASSEEVTVEKPEESRNVYELLDIFGGDILPISPVGTDSFSPLPLDDVEL